MSSTSVLKWVRIKHTGYSPSGLTRIWEIRNTRTGDKIGDVKWYGGWRKYAFFPTLIGYDWLALDPDLLQLIADFCKEKTGQQGKKRK